MKGIEERPCQLVVAGGDGAIDLEMTDHALDAIALPVETLVPANGRFAVATGRDDGPDAARLEMVADGVAVVALVGDQVGGSRLGEGVEGFERRRVVRFAAGEVEREGESSGITETMNFTGKPAPRAAKSLFASPPFAPAAETWPRTVVESMLCRRLSAIAWVRAVAAASHTPASLQRRKRWYTVIHLPYFSGRSRHGAPVRMRHRMPLTMSRLSCAGRALRPRSGGSNSFNRRHSASVRSPRLKTASSRICSLESKTESVVNYFVNSA